MIQGHGPHDDATAAYQAGPTELFNGDPAGQPKGADRSARSLHDVCLELSEKVDAFLSGEPETPLLRNVQEQLHLSMGIVEEALRQYTCVFSPLTPPISLPSTPYIVRNNNCLRFFCPQARANLDLV